MEFVEQKLIFITENTVFLFAAARDSYWLT